jgi:hypothetical protein
VGAAACSRCAVLTMSPAAIGSPASGRESRETSATPVFTAIRTSSPAPSSAIQRWIASAARTARSASSSCATGAPNTAITASPMNFSTVPPYRSISLFAAAWNGRSAARTSSGSARSERAVKPTRSTKSTETTFRSSRAAGGGRLSTGGCREGAGVTGAARGRSAGKSREGSCCRIACSSCRSALPGSIPSSSTRARRASWYAVSASAWRPLR